MPLNPLFNNYSFATEQNLLEDLIIESLKIYGVEAVYLPRTLVNEDLLYTEDNLSLFADGIELEMYIENVEGYSGERELMSKFGFEVRDQTTFIVAKKRFLQATQEGMLTEESYRTLQEDGDEILLEDGTDQGYDYSSLTNPREGDLVYMPLDGSIFEIQHIENEEQFYQLGKLYTYRLRCERMTYSSERFETANTSIDTLASDRSLDMRAFQISLEDGDALSLEDGDTFVLDEGSDGFKVGTQDPQARNEYIQSAAANGVVSYSETDPFSENMY